MNLNERELLGRRGGVPIHVLIVDDEKNIRNVFRDFCLTSELFRVTTASGGKEAIEMALREDFDIVTMDLVMPDVSGLEAIEMIKKQKPQLPMVIVTGNATDSLISQAGCLGGCRVLRKPIEIKDFVGELVELAGEKCG